MMLHFTKMQGASNDFIVINAMQAPLTLTAQDMRLLGDRHRGIGADQILVVEPSTRPGIDFRYRIFNGLTGQEVEHCGNGARCFVRYVHEHGLSTQRSVRVETVNQVLTLTLEDNGQVTVDMGEPTFSPSQLHFDTQGLTPRSVNDFPLWPLPLAESASLSPPSVTEVALVSMGNPHAVVRVPHMDLAPVASWGPAIEGHPRFAQGVNAGFVEFVSRTRIRVRVYERGAGETWACGTGACAAVVAGICLGDLDRQVDVDMRGGRLHITWPGPGHAVCMTGPAHTVFEGHVELERLAAAAAACPTPQPPTARQP